MAEFVKVIAKCMSRGEKQDWVPHVIRCDKIVAAYSAEVDEGPDAGAMRTLVATDHEGYLCQCSLADFEAALVAGNVIAEDGA